MALSRVHTDAADGTFSATGAAAWNAGHGVTGATSGGIPYFDSTTSEASSGVLTAGRVVLGGGAGAAPNDSANLTFDGTALTAVTLKSKSPTQSDLYLQNAAGTTGFIIGRSSSSNDAQNLFIYDETAAAFRLNMSTNGDVTFTTTNGTGVSIVTGTATSAVSAQSITQTWNFATSAINAVDWTFTDTSSHAGTLAWRVRGGASGTTALASLTKAGKIEAVAYRVNGTDGASFGPGLPTSITVENGIVTAIS